MRIVNYLLVLFLACVMAWALGGCGKESGEGKSLDEIKAEVANLNVDQLRSKAQEYKKSIMAKQGEITKISEQIKQIPVAEALGEETKQLKGELDQLNKSLKDLKERFGLYYNKLKEMKGDLSGLEV